MDEAPNGWLAISRMAGEGVILDVGDITIAVRVIRASRGKARIAFQAPRSVRILRRELIDETRKDSRA